MLAAKVFDEVIFPVEFFAALCTGPFHSKIMKLLHVDLAVTLFVEVRLCFAQLRVVLLERAVEYTRCRFR